MSSGKLLAIGKFAPEDLTISVGESTRKIDPAIEKQVDAIWEEKKKRAEAEGRVCYNGISYRLNSFEEKGGKLRIDFGLLEYKARQSLQTIPAYLELPEEYHHNGCYNGATVKTSDDKYLVVELSGKSMNTQTIDTLGGIMEKPQEIKNGEDVFSALYIELEEEGCIKKTDVKEIYLRAVFVTPNTHSCFYFEVTLNISSGELLKRFSNETKDQDIKSLKAFSQEEYLAFLSHHDSPTKQFIAGAREI
jgi:hypothetical protein